MSKSLGKPRGKKSPKPQKINVHIERGAQQLFLFTCGEDNTMEATFEKKRTDIFSVFDLEIAKENRRQGIGKRFLQAAAVIAKKEEAGRLNLFVPNYAGMLLCEAVFSQRAQVYRQTDAEPTEISSKAALDILKNRDESVAATDDYFIYEVRLADLKTAGWEQPIIKSSVT